MFKKATSSLVSAILILSLASCSGGGDNSNTQTTSKATSNSSELSSSQNTSNSSENKDPLGKFEEPVVLTAVLQVSTPDPGIDPDVKNPEDNYYLEVLKDQYNIEIKYIWSVPPEQFDQKMSIAMTSDDLPDILKDLTSIQYSTLEKNNRLADLSPGLDYALPTLMEYWQRIPEIFQIYNKDGKQLGLPQYWDPRRGAMLMYIRQDWLDKLGLEIPKTVEEFKEVNRAFVEDDPDGNGQKDTYGLQLSKSSSYQSQTSNTVGAYLQMFGAYPNTWIDDGSGNLIPGIIQPQVKEGLKFLNELYTAGLIDPEFVVKDSTKVTEQTVSGKQGILFSPWWAASTSPFQALLKDPSIKYVTAQIPGIDGPGKTVVDRVSISSVTALNSKAQDKVEAFIKMENFTHYWEDYTFTDYKGEFTTKLTAPVDQEKRKTRSVWNWYPGGSYLDPFDINTQFEVTNDAYNSKNPELLTIGKTHEFYSQYDTFLKMEKGEIPWANELSGFMARANPNGSWKVTRDIFEAGDYVYNEKYGLSTKTEQTKGVTLNTMAEELFIKIVMGEAPLDDFDKFVENWKKLGGDTIIQEVNENYKAQQEEAKSKQ